jgi:hypothetical protein
MKEKIFLTKNKLTALIAGWLFAALLFCPTSAYSNNNNVVESLYTECQGYTFSELLGVYNKAVMYHDNLRAKIVSSSSEEAAKMFVEQDDEWCTQRTQAWCDVVDNKDRQALWEIILLEYIRCESIWQKSLAGSFQGPYTHNRIE